MISQNRFSVSSCLIQLAATFSFCLTNSILSYIMLPTSTAHTASAWLGIYINPKSAILGHVFMFLSYYKIGLQFHLVSVFRFMYIMLSLSPTQQAHTNMYVSANSALLVSWFVVTLGHVSTAASTETHKSANRIVPLPSCMLHVNSCFMSC